MPDYTKHMFKSGDAATTEQFAESLSRQFRGGEIIELIGDVGAGKTTFVRGLAKGLGSDDPVSSPTFAINNIYRGKFTLGHYDLYRIHDDKLIKHELAELLGERNKILVFEWAEDLERILPDSRLKVSFKTTGATERELSIRIPAKYSYLEIT